MKKPVLVTIAGVLAASVAAGDSLNCRLVGYCETPGSARDVALNGDYAYVADDYDGGLRVISVSDPAHPVEVGHHNTPGEAWGVAANGDHAFVADYDAGLRVISVSDPAHPVEVGHCDTRCSAVGVDVSGSYAYVAEFGYGLQIIEFYGAGIDESQQPTATVVRGVLRIEVGSGQEAGYRGDLLDISGRKVLDLHPGPSDISHLAPGVYFVREGPSAVRHQPSAVRKVIVTR